MYRMLSAAMGAIMTATLTIPQLLCKRCGHTWLIRRPQLPKVCPKCKGDWTKEKRSKALES